MRVSTVLNKSYMFIDEINTYPKVLSTSILQFSAS